MNIYIYVCINGGDGLVTDLCQFLQPYGLQLTSLFCP